MPLHSRPGAATFIYLDFNGHVTTGTWWNKPASQNGGGYAATITTPPFSLDSDPAFSDEERRAMVAIWRGVSEDYAPFSVDVTTGARRQGGKEVLRAAAACARRWCARAVPQRACAQG